MENKVFFRVANIETNQGLWYDWEGNFTGLIHDEYDFCKNKDLPMPFDEDVKGWLSATDSLEKLWFWFPKEDILRLQPHGWFVYIYITQEWKEYENHILIKKDCSTPFLRLEISDDLEIANIEQQIKQVA